MKVNDLSENKSNELSLEGKSIVVTVYLKIILEMN